MLLLDSEGAGAGGNRESAADLLGQTLDCGDFQIFRIAALVAFAKFSQASLQGNSNELLVVMVDRNVAQCNSLCMVQSYRNGLPCSPCLVK